MVFRNHQIDCNGNTAIAMGDYLFTNATTGDEGRVEYTFGYKKNDDGKMRIFLCVPCRPSSQPISRLISACGAPCRHHSSMPYEPAAAAPANDSVEEALSMWAESIAKQEDALARFKIGGMSKP